MTLPTMAVTGSTGALGRLVAEDLAAAGLAQRLLVRDIARAPDLAGASPSSRSTPRPQLWSRVEFTFLRDNLYLDFMPQLAGEDRVIRGSAGSGRLAAVSRRDVASVASAVLRDPGAHAGATYHLTGPDAFTLAEAAQRLTARLGREFRFVDETLEEVYASRQRYGASDWLVDAWVSTYTAIAAGEMDGVTDDVERVTGWAPLRLEDVVAA